MSATIYIEGGGDSKELHTRCREAFHKLLSRCGFSGRMPQLVACGRRETAYRDFKIAHASARGAYVAMIVDSEDPVANVNETWAHLAVRDKWAKPDGADDEQVFLMVTCMETWIVSDHETLAGHYGQQLQVSALPALSDLETRARDDIQGALSHATRTCANAYRKGKRSFEVLGKLNPETLEAHLPSFKRMRVVLGNRL